MKKCSIYEHFPSGKWRKAVLLMKLKLVLILCFAGSVSANTTYSQQATYDVAYRNVKITEVLRDLRARTGYSFVYMDGVISENKTVTLAMKGSSLEEILDELLAGNGYQYRIRDNIVLVTAAAVQQQQAYTVAGRVADRDGKPLAGVAVAVKGMSGGTVTDAQGRFSVRLEGTQTLVFSFLGMKSVEMAVERAATDLRVVLEAQAYDVDEVVVTGYFTRKASTYTGNAITYSGDELRQVSSSNIMASLSMIEPSFKMVIDNEYGSDPNRIPDIQVQGPTNLQNEYSNTPNMPTFILDGFEVTPQVIFDLDPGRVKNVTLLKDATATAIYGSRAANGVVVVETLTPNDGRLTFSYNFSGDFEVADLSSYNLMNAAEKLEYEVAAGLFIQKNGYPPAQESLDIAYNNKLALVQQGIDTDWIKKPVHSVGFSHKHAMMVEGGSQTFRYAVDLNYRGQKGIMKHSGRDNYGLGVKIQYAHKKLKFSNYLVYNNTKQYNSPYGSFATYAALNPYFSPYDENGNVVYQLYKAVTSVEENVYNPMFNATINTKDETVIDNISERFSIEYDLVDGLKLKGNLSLDRSTTNSDNFKPNRHTSFAGVTENKGSYTNTNITNTTYDITASALYFKEFGRHAVNLAAIYNVRESKSNTYSVTAYNFPNDNFDHIGMAIKYKDGDRPGGFMDISRLMGVAFNANYSYADRYLADFSLRSDGSSVFGADKRWGTFWSAGVGWNLHYESFLRDVQGVNALKLRASYGTTGGQNFYPYQAMMMYSYQQLDGTYDGEIGALAMAYGNPNLKWQVTEKFNVGVDFGFFGQRLTGYVNRYVNLTKDKLIDFTLAPSTGFGTYTVNLGNVKNEGWEVNVKGTILRNYESNLRWDVFVNMVTNKNKLTDINDALTSFNEKQNENVSNMDFPTFGAKKVKHFLH